MRVLMLGWDFSPRLSGGVGSACRGLSEALTRAGTEVLFVLPRLRGDEEPASVRLVSSEEAARNAPVPDVLAEPFDPAPIARAERVPVPEDELRFTPTAPSASAELRMDAEDREPSLPAPSESLRLLALDSPLRPYLGEAEYATLVRGLFARIRRPAGRASRESAVSARGGRGQGLVAAPHAARSSRAKPASARQLLYGETRGAEVERYARTVLAAVAHERFDVVHAHDWMTFPAGLLVKEQHGLPLLVHFHSNESERRGERAAADVHAIEQAALDGADRVLCVSHASARELRERYTVETAKVRVLHNAFSPPEGGVTERAPDRAPVVLYLGRLAQQKGPDVFLDAAARVHARDPRCRFVLAGDGELYPELVARARELGLADVVRFTGFLAGEALAQAYRGADVYVMPSAAEPFGISALEALSMGVPTIVSRGAGVTEVVRSVLRFATGDAADLAEKVVALLERPALRRALVASGLREVKDVRWERPARALRAFYDEVVA